MPARTGSRRLAIGGRRSRSPRASFTSSRLPQLKTWVLVRTSDPGQKHQRQWSNATAALVSQVSVGSDPGDTRVTVILPRLLTLRCGFGGSGFKELDGLPLSEIRPYSGTDLPKLKRDLLRAVQEEAKARKAKREERQEDPMGRALPIPLVAGESAVPPIAVLMSAEMHIAPPALELEITPPADLADGLPVTPKSRCLERNPTPEAPPMPAKSMVVAKEPMTKLRLQEFMRAMVMVFNDTGESMLTRRELARTLTVKRAGLGEVAEGELDEALKVLDAANKVFCSNDLVFLLS